MFRKLATALLLLGVHSTSAMDSTCKMAAGGVPGTCFHNPQARLKTAVSATKNKENNFPLLFFFLAHNPTLKLTA